MMRSLDGLNSQQKQAVESCDSNLLVVAGAGSGKTRVLTHKICYLIEEKGLYPSEILAMTFSNKAAREMKDRVQILLPSFEQPRWIGTFHSTCLKLLKEFHLQAGIEQQFSIFDEADQLALIKRILKEMDVDPKHLPPKAIKWNISSAKNESIHPIELLRNENQMSSKALEVAQKYQEELEKNQAMDFGDLLIRMIKLVQENEQVRDILQKRWKYILIDEFQDTNAIQKMLIQQIKGPQTKVCAVGDEDQCIYTWRGAQVENMLEFEEDFSPSQTVKLDQNYRSTKPILDVANAVISHNVGRRKKELWTTKQEGPSVDFYLAEDDYAEARHIIDQVMKGQRQGKPLSDFCVLYRTHVQSRVIEDEARRRNIAYRILGGTRFYDRAEIKDVLSMLKLITNPFDNVAFERIINKPARGIGPKTVQNLRDLSLQLGTSMFQVIPKLKGSSKAHQALGEFYLTFQKLAETAFEEKPTKITEKLLEKTSYLKALENEHTIEADARIENIEELLRTMSDFEEQTGLGLLEFMDQVSLSSDADTQNYDAPMLTMMTIHNSKGLEYPHIFVVGLEEGVFPHQRAIEENGDDELEEERRLCYVAMTRAEDKLTLLAAARRKLYRFTMYNPLSRFLEEIPEQLYNKVFNPNLDSQTPNWRAGQDSAYDPYSQLNEFELASQVLQKTKAKKNSDSPYQPGAFVEHPNFGRGLIKKSEGPDTNLKLTIAFERAGVKKIMLNYVDLEIIHPM
ncbi:MAG: UvrD-helicase domain-containing protein [Bdellovibrionales bacterium]|nr:UvrD-helicase domain-containing protein [Bdellovibrionales bacterium]